MPEYTYQLEVERSVKEVVRITVDADDREEAQDYAYHIASEYPATSMVADRFVILDREYGPVESVEFVDDQRV